MEKKENSHKATHRHPGENLPSSFGYQPFYKKYPDISRNLKSNANKIVSHDYLYHTILSLGQIESSLKKEKLDLTSPDAKEFTPPENNDLMTNGNITTEHE